MFFANFIIIQISVIKQNCTMNQSCRYIMPVYKASTWSTYLLKIRQSQNKMMETIGHSVPTCETDAEHYCMVGTEAGGAIDTFMKLKSSCKKQCKNKGSKLVIRKACR